ASNRAQTELEYKFRAAGQQTRLSFVIIQQRSKIWVGGRLSFERNWTEYENGFGDAEEFWVGLRAIHHVTGSSPRQLRVEAVSHSNILYVAEYSHFSVAGSDTNYVMTYKAYLSGHSNTTGDSLSTHKGMQFSTMDRDNDKKSGSCSKSPRLGATQA
uniref:Fibrinogen C-terminal domain-containing protein n=1 Tax=Macrostomum lignano TaxID=282301 RepID=A0A1I8HV19_9PLAT